MAITVGGISTQLRDSKTFAQLLNAAPALAKKDPTLWGVEATAEAQIRLNWVDLPLSSRALLPEIALLVKWADSKSLTEVILAGMGGSSLAPEVMAKSYRKNLTVLDTTDPDQIHRAIPESLTNTLVVVGSKSGSTVETASQKALFESLFVEAGLDPIEHMVIVTDPSSPLDKASRAAGFRTINADPNVGGRYSALSAFGLVPAALIGIDIEAMLAQAEKAAETFTSPDSPAVLLATALFEAGEQNVAFSDFGSDTPGLSDWIEQLVAESTGKNERGRLPIAIEHPEAMVAGPHLLINLANGGSSTSESAGIQVNATLGEQFILWEWVTALLSIALEVDPFNQPNVTEAKERTNAILAKWATGERSVETPSLEDDLLQIFSPFQGETLKDHLTALLSQPGHYIAVMAYLARGINDEITQCRSLIAQKSGRGTTFGWGPRFLHSTGQFHKGGQHNGVFLQITGENERDLAIPGSDFTFHTLLMAQALGDGEALADRNFPLMRIHLKDRAKGISAILEALS